MIYPSEIEQKQQEDTFIGCGELYLKSKSIHEYIVERDTQFPSINSINDPYVWWYIYKERTGSYYLCAIASAILLQVCWLALSIFCAWPLWVILVASVLIGVVTSVFIAANTMMIVEFGKKIIRFNNRDFDNRYDDFKSLDERYARKLMSS